MHFAQVIFKIEKLYIKIELLDKKKKGEEGKKKGTFPEGGKINK